MSKSSGNVAETTDDGQQKTNDKNVATPQMMDLKNRRKFIKFFVPGLTATFIAGYSLTACCLYHVTD
jgi:hypothetical protein